LEFSVLLLSVYLAHSLEKRIFSYSWNDDSLNCISDQCVNIVHKIVEDTEGSDI
jgi:hypothetical protein